VQRFTLTFSSLSLWLASAACIPVAHGTPARGNHTVLLELFTSQGCSSCPTADALVRELPRLGFDRRKVVPLVFHVDYWNDLGWTDPFSTAAFTARQRHYADARGLRSPDGEDGIHGLYTPQMILDGTIHFSGARRQVALVEIERARAQPAVIDLEAEVVLEADRARVKARVAVRQSSATGERWQVVVAVAEKTTSTRVTRGENSGETLAEAAVVRALSVPVRVALPQAQPVEIVVPRPKNTPWSALELSAFVQSETTLHVAAARMLE
jgi:hypothetical protein